MQYACKMKVLLFQNSRPLVEASRAPVDGVYAGTATRSREGKTERPIPNQSLRRVREQVLDTVHGSRVAENNFIKGGEYAMPMAAHEERLTTTLAVIAAWARVLEFHSHRAPACH
jgi:hypothetical protein